MTTALSFEGFEDVRYLGQGGLAVVYRATQVAFDRVVALKVMRIGAENEEAARLFDRECTAAGRLAWHPNVVSIYDRGVVDGHLYLVLEYYAGGTIAEEVQRRGPLPLDEVTQLGIKLSGALVTAHGEGVLHRDIKPQNVLLSSLGEPALTDFGLAAIAGQSATTTGAGFSPAFSPPEVYSGAIPHARGDIYSLGATLFHAATGMAPFGRSGATVASVVGDVISGRMVDPPREFADSPLFGVVSTALATVPADRFATAADLAAGLQRIERSEGRSATPVPTPDMVTIRPGVDGEGALPGSTSAISDASAENDVGPQAVSDTDSPPPRRRGRFAVAILVAVGLVAAGAFAINSSDEGGSEDMGADSVDTDAATPSDPYGEDPCRNVEIDDSFGTVLDERQLGFVNGQRVDVPEECEIPPVPASSEAMLAGEASLLLLDGAEWTNLGTQGVMDAPAVASFAGTNAFPGSSCWAISLPRVVIADDARTIWSQNLYLVAVNFFDTATESDAEGLFQFNSLVNGADSVDCAGFDEEGLARWPSDASVDYQDVPVEVEGVDVNVRSIPGARAPEEFALSPSDHLYRVTAWRDTRIVEIDVVSQGIGPITDTRFAGFVTPLLETYFPAG